MTIHNRSLWNGKKEPRLVAKSLEHLPSRGRDFAPKFASQTAA